MHWRNRWRNGWCNGVARFTRGQLQRGLAVAAHLEQASQRAAAGAADGTCSQPVANLQINDVKQAKPSGSAEPQVPKGMVSRVLVFTGDEPHALRRAGLPITPHNPRCAPSGVCPESPDR